MSAFSAAASRVASAANAMLAVPVVYLAASTLVSRGVRRRQRGPDRRPETSTTFVVLVPAHNEASSVAATITSVVQQEYPPSMFSVHVVADNCVDSTATIAANAGAIVHERNDPDDRGKGPALNWLVDRLIDGGVPFDVAVFVDADTVLEEHFLRALDGRFADGAVAVQGQYLVRDAFQSTATALRFCSLASRHHARPLARNAIGGSCGLFGNGMAFTRDIVAMRRWSSHLVEDMEFQLELLLAGVLVDYEPLARLEAEMPDSFDASVTQHRRWELGRADMVQRYAPQLGRATITGRSPDGTRVVRRVAAVDALLDMCVPPISLLASATVLATASGAALGAFTPRDGRRNAYVSASLMLLLGVHVVDSMRSVGAPKEAYRALLQAPRLAVWKIGVLAKSRVGSKDDWIRTARNAERDGRVVTMGVDDA